MKTLTVAGDPGSSRPHKPAQGGATPPPATTFDTPMMLPEDVVAYWRGAVTVSTLAHWRTLGTGPKWTRVGRRAMYRRDWLDAFTEQQSRTSTSEVADTRVT